MGTATVLPVGGAVTDMKPHASKPWPRGGEGSGKNRAVPPSSRGSMELLTVGHPGDPAFDMAVSHALLLGVAAGELPETARIFRPGPTLAFGRLDALREGYPRACAAAAARGWTPVLRLGGGHAAGYDGGSVVFELVTRNAHVAEGLQERFAAGVGVLVAALTDLGIDVAIGELPGEYCPGRWSVHLVGGPKIAGAAQRTVRGASLLTAVVVVQRGAELREALVAVYDELGLAWDPATAGSAAEGRAGTTSQEVTEALLGHLARRAPAPVPGELRASTIAAAHGLLAQHAT